MAVTNRARGYVVCRSVANPLGSHPEAEFCGRTAKLAAIVGISTYPHGGDADALTLMAPLAQLRANEADISVLHMRYREKGAVSAQTLRLRIELRTVDRERDGITCKTRGLAMVESIPRPVTAMEPSIGDQKPESAMLEDIRGIVEAFRGLYDMAYDEYLPLVDDICSRDASEYEVEHLLDYLIDFAGEDRMLLLYKRVCRRYFYSYPGMIANHIYMWRDTYDEDYVGGNDERGD